MTEFIPGTYDLILWYDTPFGPSEATIAWSYGMKVPEDMRHYEDMVEKYSGMVGIWVDGPDMRREFIPHRRIYKFVIVKSEGVDND